MSGIIKIALRISQDPWVEEVTLDMAPVRKDLREAYADAYGTDIATMHLQDWEVMEFLDFLGISPESAKRLVNGGYWEEYSCGMDTFADAFEHAMEQSEGYFENPASGGGHTVSFSSTHGHGQPYAVSVNGSRFGTVKRNANGRWCPVDNSNRQGPWFNTRSEAAYWLVYGEAQ